MTEPENQTLRLLRDIRAAAKTVDGKVDGLETKVDRNHEEILDRLEAHKQAAFAKACSAAMPPPRSKSVLRQSKDGCPRSKRPADASLSSAPR